MLPIAKWFLDRKRKNNEEEKKVELSLLGFRLPVSCRASQRLTY